MLQAIHYVIPTLLFFGASWLIMQEVFYFRRSPRKQLMRLGRRLVGGLALLAIAAMMHKGDTTLIFMEKNQAAQLAQKDPVYVGQCLNYWFTLMGLVCGTVVLALWDVVASLLNIRVMLGEAARQDIKAFQEALEKCQKLPHNGKQPQPKVTKHVLDPRLDFAATSSQEKRNESSENPEGQEQPKVSNESEAKANSESSPEPKGEDKPNSSDESEVKANSESSPEPKGEDKPKSSDESEVKANSESSLEPKGEDKPKSSDEPEATDKSETSDK